MSGLFFFVVAVAAIWLSGALAREAALPWNLSWRAALYTCLSFALAATGLICLGV